MVQLDHGHFILIKHLWDDTDTEGCGKEKLLEYDASEEAITQENSVGAKSKPSLEEY